MSHSSQLSLNTSVAEKGTVAGVGDGGHGGGVGIEWSSGTNCRSGDFSLSLSNTLAISTMCGPHTKGKKSGVCNPALIIIPQGKSLTLLFELSLIIKHQLQNDCPHDFCMNFSVLH